MPSLNTMVSLEFTLLSATALAALFFLIIFIIRKISKDYK